MESHLAQCPTCRRELIDAREILTNPRRFRWRVLGPVAAAVAAGLLLISWPQDPTVPNHRGTPTEVLAAPTPLSPLGAVPVADSFLWQDVPGADRYRLTIFDSRGTVLWKHVTDQSSVSVPDSLVFTVGEQYLWRVEARVGWDVWESSRLVEVRFTGGDGSSPRLEDGT